jgi:predicted MFS family arabinose efflux permease
MTAVFASAAVSSALASTLYDADGWSAVTALGGAFAGVGLVVWLFEQALRRRPREISV